MNNQCWTMIVKLWKYYGKSTFLPSLMPGSGHFESLTSFGTYYKTPPMLYTGRGFFLCVCLCVCLSVCVCVCVDKISQKVFNRSNLFLVGPFPVTQGRND